MSKVGHIKGDRGGGAEGGVLLSMLRTPTSSPRTTGGVGVRGRG